MVPDGRNYQIIIIRSLLFLIILYDGQYFLDDYLDTYL